MNPPECTCSGPGTCSRYRELRSHTTQRQFELCKGLKCTPEQSVKYRNHWDKQVAEKTGKALPLVEDKPAERGICRHQGEPADRESCGTCQRKWNYDCEVYGICTPTIEKSGNLAICDNCPHHQADDAAEDRGSPTPLIFENNLPPGDVLVMSGAVESLHLAYPGKFITDYEGTASSIFDNNPFIRKLTGEVRKKARRISMQYPLVHQSNQKGVHFLQGYVEYLSQELDLPIPLAVNKPVLRLSPEEKAWLPQVEGTLKRPGKYWIINAGYKTDFSAKFWGLGNYQQVVDHFHGRILFVQIGELSNNHVHEPLKGVLDFRGKTDTRELIRLCYHAAGGLGPTTFFQHIMAALEKRYFCLLGAREPVQWTSYPLQTTFHNIGSLSCAKTEACWKSRTIQLNEGNNGSLCLQPTPGDDPVPRCMAMIKPRSVIEAIEQHLSGDCQ